MRQLFLLYTFLGFAIPGGVVYGVNYKFFLLPIILAFGIGHLIFNNKNVKISGIQLLFFIVVSVMLTQGLMVGLSNNPDYVFEEFRLVFSIFIIFSLYYIIFRYEIESHKKFLQVAVYGVFFYNIFKLCLELLFILKFIDFEAIETITLNYGGRVPVTSPLPFDMIRLYWTEMDLASICVAYIFYVINVNDTFGRYFKRIFYLTIFLGVIIGFSRLLIVLAVISFLVAMFFKFGPAKAFIKISFIALLLSTVAVGPLSELLEKRFSESYIKTADDVRHEQVVSLLEKWSESPVLGEGFGASASILRSDEKPYQYEIWWLSFWMKTGVLGVVSFLILLLLPITLLNVGYSKESKYILFIYYIFILSSFTNQYMPSSISGLMLTLIYFSLKQTIHNVKTRNVYVTKN